MHKYSFLVYHADFKDFLSRIRKLGVVHIDQKVTEPTPEMQELYREIKDIELTLKKLDWYTEKPETRGDDYKNGEAVFRRMKAIEKEQEYLQHHRARLEKEESQLEPWGNFDFDNLRKLEEQGLEFRFFTCSARKFQTQWQVEHPISLINDESGIYYFIRIDRKGTDITPFLEESGVEQVFLPTSSLNAVKEELHEIIEKQSLLQTELKQIAAYQKEKLKEYYNKVRDELSGKNALLQSTGQVEGKVRFLQGYVPENKKAELDRYLEEQGILYISEIPSGKEEKVPVLLKNNRFARLYEVIGNLYDLPNHREMDLVPFFAPFYMMFFGFALGDAGYGLLILIACTFAKRKMPNMKDILSLAQWLGLATLIFGILTGTIFGISLIEAKIPALENFKQYMIDTDKMFTLAIILGVIQIIFGMFVKVFNIRKQLGIAYSLPTIGWLILLLGSMILFGMKKAGIISVSAASIAQYIVLGVAGVLILLLNNPRRNIIMNFLSGLWDTYGMATGLLGDLLSYIRLFALGVSTAILGNVFNQLALNMKPDIIIVGELVMIIILLVGHGITLFMAGLGAFVHPIRLTFVEFYKNAGFTGGGRPYTPFEQHSK